MLRGLAGIVKGTSYIERPNHWIALGKPTLIEAITDEWPHSRRD
jgi:hypothetical protein